MDEPCNFAAAVQNSFSVGNKCCKWRISSTLGTAKNPMLTFFRKASLFAENTIQHYPQEDYLTGAWQIFNNASVMLI